MKSMLFVVQYCVNPKLSGALRDVTMTLQLPKPLGQPTKVCQRNVDGINYVAHLPKLSRVHCPCKAYVIFGMMCGELLL